MSGCSARTRASMRAAVSRICASSPRACGAGRAVHRPAVDRFLARRSLAPCLGVVRCRVCQPRRRCSRRIDRVRKVYPLCSGMEWSRTCRMRTPFRPWPRPWRRALACDARRPGVDDVAQEGLEHQQGPQRRAVVALARLMGVDQVLQILAVEPAGRQQARAQHGLAHARLQRAAEPACQRHRETHLRPVQDVVRQLRLHRLLQQELALLPAHLQVRRQRGQPLDQRVVHQRFAHFERVRHAGPVDLGVDVADQIGLQVQVLDQRQRIVGVRLRGVAVEDLRARRSRRARA